MASELDYVPTRGAQLRTSRYPGFVTPGVNPAEVNRINATPSSDPAPAPDPLPPAAPAPLPSEAPIDGAGQNEGAPATRETNDPRDLIGIPGVSLGFRAMSELAKAQAELEMGMDPATRGPMGQARAAASGMNGVAYEGVNFDGRLSAMSPQSNLGPERGYGDDTRGHPGNPGGATGTPSLGTPGVDADYGFGGYDNEGAGPNLGTPGVDADQGFGGYDNEGAGPNTSSTDTSTSNDSNNGGGNGGNDSGGGSDSSAGNGSCFVLGTPMLMADGSERSNAEIKKGDKVACYVGLGPLVEGVVTDVIDDERDDVVDLDGVGSSPNHGWLAPSQDFVRADALAVAVTADGRSVPIVATPRPGRHRVRNFTVEPHHTYVVKGKTHFYRVHNEKREGGQIPSDNDGKLEPRMVKAHETEVVIRPEVAQQPGVAKALLAVNDGAIPGSALVSLHRQILTGPKPKGSLRHARTG